jgi:hypothetical protein
MNEAESTDTTAAPCRHRTFLASVPLAELVAAAKIHLAALNAGVNRDDDDGDGAMASGCQMDAGLLRMIADRPAATLADVALKAALARERLAAASWGTAEEEALALAVLDEVARFAAGRELGGASA